MPYTVLASRTDGEILKANYLNALSENADWIYGQAHSINMPFQGFKNNSIASIDDTDVYWYLRHRHQYYHYKVDVNDPLDYIRFKATDGTSTYTLFSDESPGATQSWNSYADTNGLGMSSETWHKLWWEISFVSGSNSISVSRIVASDGTSFGTETDTSSAVPPTWSRGDTVAAADMNKYKSILDRSHALIGDEQMVFPVRLNNTEDRGFFFRNFYRWLHYIGDGEIIDPSGSNDTTTIAGSGSTVQVYDIYNVDWIAQGVLYEIKDCTFACEDYAA